MIDPLDQKDDIPDDEHCEDCGELYQDCQCFNDDFDDEEEQDNE